jgi:hypothetical protein
VLLLANTIGLFIANLVLEDMSVTASAFIIDVVIFTVVVGVTTPFMRTSSADGSRPRSAGSR